MNTSFGVEFGDEVICAVDKLERDYVLKEVNSRDLVTEATQAPNQDVPRRRNENFSRSKVVGNLRSSGRRKMRTSDVDSKCLRSRLVEDAMSLTVIKGHNSEKIVSSACDEAGDQDVVCTWNTPLLVSTPVVVTSKQRRVGNENVVKPDEARDTANAAGSTGMTVTPKQLNSARMPKTKAVEKTKLFGDFLNTSPNVCSPTESACLQNRSRSPGCSDRRDNLSDGRGTSASAISNPDSKLMAYYIFVCIVICNLPAARYRW